MSNTSNTLLTTATVLSDDVTKYSDVEFNRPFFILHKDPRRQDITVWRKDHAYENEPNNPSSVLRLFFHGENFWCNPPTDSNMEYNAIKKIERYGIAYLTDPDEYIEGYKRCAWNEGNKYRQDYADKFFATLTPTKETEK